MTFFKAKLGPISIASFVVRFHRRVLSFTFSC